MPSKHSHAGSSSKATGMKAEPPNLVQKLLKRKRSSKSDNNLNVANKVNRPLHLKKKCKYSKKKGSKFLDLPAEIHAIIYHFLFADSSFIVRPVLPTAPAPLYRLFRQPAEATTILQTCSIIHNGAKEALKRENKTLQIVGDFKYWKYQLLKKKLSLAMPTEWKGCIETITYSGNHAQVLINLTQFPNLKQIRVETKMYHFPANGKPADTGATAMILNKARKQHKSLAEHTHRWTHRLQGVKVVSKIWLFNKKNCHNQGWVAELDWTNMQIISIARATFTKQEDSRLDWNNKRHPAGDARSPLPRYWRRVWKQGLDAWQAEIE